MTIELATLILAIAVIVIALIGFIATQVNVDKLHEKLDRQIENQRMLTKMQLNSAYGKTATLNVNSAYPKELVETVEERAERK